MAILDLKKVMRLNLCQWRKNDKNHRRLCSNDPEDISMIKTAGKKATCLRDSINPADRYLYYLVS